MSARSVVTFMAAAIVAVASSLTVFVRTDGSDSCSGARNVSAAVDPVSCALASIPWSLALGVGEYGFVDVQAGAYFVPNGVTVTTPRVTYTARGSVMLMGTPSRTAFLVQANATRVQGFAMWNFGTCVHWRDVDDVVVEGNTCVRPALQGMWFMNSRRAALRNNVMMGNTSALWNDALWCQTNPLNDTEHFNEDVEITGNVVLEWGGYGIHLLGKTRNALVANNVLQGTTKSACLATGLFGNVNVTFRDNVVEHSEVGAEFTGVTGLLLERNTFRNCSSRYSISVAFFVRNLNAQVSPTIANNSLVRNVVVRNNVYEGCTNSSTCVYNAFQDTAAHTLPFGSEESIPFKGFLFERNDWRSSVAVSVGPEGVAFEPGSTAVDFVFRDNFNSASGGLGRFRICSTSPITVMSNVSIATNTAALIVDFNSPSRVVRYSPTSGGEISLSGVSEFYLWLRHVWEMTLEPASLLSVNNVALDSKGETLEVTMYSTVDSNVVQGHLHNLLHTDSPGQGISVSVNNVPQSYLYTDLKGEAKYSVVVSSNASLRFRAVSAVQSQVTNTTNSSSRSSAVLHSSSSRGGSNGSGIPNGSQQNAKTVSFVLMFDGMTSSELGALVPQLISELAARLGVQPSQLSLTVPGDGSVHVKVITSNPDAVLVRIIRLQQEITLHSVDDPVLKRATALIQVLSASNVLRLAPLSSIFFSVAVVCLCMTE